MKNTVTALFRPLLVAGLVSLGAQTMPALAQTAQIAVSSASYGGVRDLDIELNKSIIVDLPAGVAEVIVSQPNVAAAIMRTRTRAIVQGIGGGDTNIFFIDDNGRTIQVLDLRVIKEPSQVGNALEEALARVIPGSKISVESVTLRDETNRVVLTGTVLSSDDKMRAEQVAIQFAGKPENVANILDVSGAQRQPGELAERVGLLVGQAAATEDADGVGAVGLAEVAQPGGDQVEGDLPTGRDQLAVHPHQRFGEPVGSPEHFTGGPALLTQPPPIGREVARRHRPVGPHRGGALQGAVGTVGGHRWRLGGGGHTRAAAIAEPRRR